MFGHWLGHCLVLLLEAGVVYAMVGAGLEVAAKLATVAVGTALVGVAYQVSKKRRRRTRALATA